MTKEQDDVVARSVAETQLADLITGQSGVADDDRQAATAVLGELAETVRFETAVSKVKGSEVPMRRLHMIGPWEVNPAGRQ